MTLLAMLGLLAAPAMTPQDPASSAAERVDAFVRERMEEHAIPGLALAVTRGDRVVRTAAYGLASLELGVPCETSTVFRLGSTTKLLTAVAVMALVEEGQVSLDDPLVDLVPEAPEAWRGPTLHHVLTHTSGLPDVYPEHRDARAFDELLARIAERPVVSAPGEAWSYNQTGYLLARRVVELARGMEWPEVLATAFGRPCGLVSLQLGGDEAVVRGRAAYYQPSTSADRVRPAETIDHPWYLWSATGVDLSVEDFARFDLCLRRGDLLAREALERLWEPTRRPDGTIFGFRGGALLYGRGFALLHDAERQAIRAVGGEGGTSTAYWHYPDDDLTVIVMTNLHADTPLATEIAEGVAAVHRGEAAPPATNGRATLAAEVEREVRRAMDRAPFPGIAVGVVVDGELVHRAGFGAADLDTRAPVDARTLFQAGSLSKALTTTLAAILVDEGLLAWESSVAASGGVELAPALDAGRITLELLASHRSGLPATPTVEGRTVDPELVLGFSHFELLQSLRTAEPVGAPGERFHYSNLGYGLLGHLLELRTGRPFELLLRERLLEPLGMDATTATLGPEHARRLATPYHVAADGRVERTLSVDMEALAPAGGITSSVEDLAAFVALHLGSAAPRAPRIGDASLARLHGRLTSFGNGLGYALGWGTDELAGVGPIVFHDGRCSGFTSYAGLSREHGVGVVVLANLGGDATPRPFRELGHGILRAAVELER